MQEKPVHVAGGEWVSGWGGMVIWVEGLLCLLAGREWCGGMLHTLRISPVNKPLAQ